MAIMYANILLHLGLKNIRFCWLWLFKVLLACSQSLKIPTPAEITAGVGRDKSWGGKDWEQG
jgi:hypothetical protein